MLWPAIPFGVGAPRGGSNTPHYFPRRAIARSSSIPYRSDLILSGSARPSVVDLGSGFGGMAHYLMNMTPVPSDIILLDIPLNLTTAYAYLRVTNPRSSIVLVKTLEQLEQLSSQRENIEENQVILVPSILAADVARLFPPTVLHNAQSLSEMSLATIRFYLELLVIPATKVVIESNVSDAFATVNSGHIEVGSGEISRILTERGMSLLSRSIRDSAARYVVSTHIRL